MKQVITKLIVLTLLLTLSFSCERINRFKLENTISKMNSECPAEIEGFGTVLSYELSGDVVVVKLQYSKENLDFVKKAWEPYNYEQRGEFMALSMILLAKNDDSIKKGFIQFFDAGCGLKLIYINKNDETDKVVIEITKEQIKKAQKFYADAAPEELAFKLVEIDVRNTKTQLPINEGKRIKLVACDILDSYVINVYEMDDSNVDFGKFEAHKEELKNKLLFENKMADSFFDDCRTANLGLKFIYKGKKSGNSFEIKIESSELPNLIE